MMDTGSPGSRESAREAHPPSALVSNAAAVRAVAAAVETTLGPKGLNCMLVDRGGDVTVTNDGSTILSLLDASHPAAQIVVRAARSQEMAVGDGTTTTAVLASALIQEGAARIAKGVPVAMLVSGVRSAVDAALKHLEDLAEPCSLHGDERLEQAVVVAARGEQQVAWAVVQAARAWGDRILEEGFDLRESIVLDTGGTTEELAGVVIDKDPLNAQMPHELAQAKVLILSDALEPEPVDSSALSTESGFSTYLQKIEEFKATIESIISAGIRFICVQKGVHDLAEERMTEAGCLVLRRLGVSDLARLADHTGARPVKRSALTGPESIGSAAGSASRIEFRDNSRMVVVSGGGGKPAAAIIVGAETREVNEELRRVAEDACGGLQAALRSGLVPGGGAAELSASLALRKAREDVGGMQGYGWECVAEALKRPLAQIVANAGYNALERVERAAAEQQEWGLCDMGVDCDTGETVSMSALGVWDPLGVKSGAIRTAAEIADAILRINNIVRMKSAGSTEAPGPAE